MALQKSLLKFRNPTVYVSITKRNLPIERKDKKQDYTKQRREIEKKKKRLLEKKIKNIKVELRSLGISRKKVYKTYIEGVETFFRKARQ